MTPATDEERVKLGPYIAGAREDERGEIDMYCPLHNDTRRSASLNLDKGLWFCHAGCGGGSVRRLVESAETWVAAEGRVSNNGASAAPTFASDEHPTLDDVRRWHRRLMNSRKRLRELTERKLITPDTAARARLGWSGKHFKIPVFDGNRELWNVRSYDMNVSGDRRKIWSVRGMGRARLYPIGVFGMAEAGDCVLFCEGEWDTLLALQHGYYAVTRTDGAGKPWHPEWDVMFAGLRVFIVQDRDVAGEKSERIVRKALAPVAEEIRTCTLPYPLQEKDGKDLTDFIRDQYDPELAIGDLMAAAT